MPERVRPDRGHADVAWAVLAGPDGQAVRLGVGDMIGRLPTAALVVDDPRVSEAHALVSLRGGGLHLLSLRRMIAVGGKPASDVRLHAGLTVELASGVAVTVVEVNTPDTVLAIELPGHAPRPLPPVASLLDDPLRVVPRFVPDALLHLWEAGQVWRARRGDAPARALHPGDRFALGGVEVAITTVPLARLQPAQTETAGGAIDPLRVVARYDVVELHRHQRQPLVLGGLGAQIISELVACAAPLHWSVLARDLWPAHRDDPELRHRWDVALNRLRTKLRDAGVRGDLLHADHGGRLTLMLYDGDTVEDRS